MKQCRISIIQYVEFYQYSQIQMGWYDISFGKYYVIALRVLKDARYNYVSKLIINVLEEAFKLQEHLLALRRYHFMELADWADLFILSLWRHVFLNSD
jgi:hypothetical protein